MATQVLSQIANYLATVPLQRKQQQYENELANRRLALQEDEAKRKAEADALALESTQFEQQQRNEGQQQLGEYNRAAEIQPSINELKQGKELTKNVAPYSMDYLLAQPEATQLALTDKYKLSQYSKYNKGVESTLEQLNKKNEVEQKQVRAPGVYGARLDAFRTNPNAVPELIQSIENYHDIGKLKDQDYNYLMARVKTDPVQASLAMDDIVIKPLVAGETISAQTDPKVEQKYKLIAPEAATEEATTKTKEITKRDIQAENPILSENQGNALQDSYSAVKYLNQMKSALESGNLDWFDQTKVGEFKNPKMNNARNQMVEIVGRKRSGAAISDSEWKNFQNQVLNKNYLLTEEGRKEALNNINDYLDRFYGAGVTTTGNEDWYNVYEAKAKKARELTEKKTTEPAAGTTPTQSAIDKLKQAAKSGNAKAQNYLKSKGQSW